MSFSAQKNKLSISFVEYLSLEEKAETKHEFDNGQITAMSGGTLDHGAIISNINFALQNELRKKGSRCRTLDSNVKIYIEEYNNGVYPDVSIICDEPNYYSDRDDVITNPLLVVEVLSKSTEDYDRGNKFKKYRSLPSFKEYVLISQYETKVETWYKMEPNVWRISQAVGLESTIELFSINCVIKLSDIYYLIEKFN